MDPLANAIDRLASVLERLEKKLDSQLPETGSKQQAAALLKVTPRTLDRKIEKGEFQLNVHYWREGRKIVFDMPLLEDWQRNRDNPSAHNRAIEVRRQELLSAKKKRRG